MADEQELRDYLKWVTTDLHRTRQRLAELEDGATEPIAVIGMACRYPGGIKSPADLWRTVSEGVDVIGPLPDDRGWGDLDALYDPDPDNPGTCYVREGGFLTDVAEFDGGFFGISPRESTAMDPQQRLLLESCWEAVEQAGLTADALRGSRTGVYAGVSQQDYATLLASSEIGIDGYAATGIANSVLSGRVSYVLGLEGPAVTVDTACSSSLVALHLAVQALRTGECDLAFAGGATVMSTPAVLVALSRQRALGQDGRCKAFSADADGAGWSEGAGVLLVERLSDARRLGHPVLAVVRGSAVNQDGASNGLTAPNGPAQQRVIRAALAQAGLTPADVTAVEAHGTGTKLGDPIEADALLATYGQAHTPADPLWLGSVKSNLGHTQAASGVAGVIKMVEALRRRELPRTLHADERTPFVNWDSGAVELLTHARPWPVAEDGPRSVRRAGVSSFGISGTNAHVVLEEAPAGQTPVAGPAPALLPWVLSAHSPAALRGQAERVAARVRADADLDVADLGFALATTRTALEHRAAVVGEDREGLLRGLDAIASGGRADGVVDGTAVGGKVVFVFPGQSSQWRGMGRHLLESSEVFAESAQRCAREIERLVDWRVLDVLRDEPGAASLDRIDVIQPVLFTMMVSLAEVWRSLGVVPDAVVGHSQGEIAAAYLSGGLSLTDAVRVVVLRSKAWVPLEGKGGMASALLSPAEAEARIEKWGDRLSVAAKNSPQSCAVAGEAQACDEFVEACLADGIRARRLHGIGGAAGHSRGVEVVRDHILDVLAPVAPVSGTVAFYSTVTAGPLDTTELDHTYWYRNMREPVAFEGAVRELLADGHRHFLEMSPHPLLALSLQQTIDDAGVTARVVSSLRRDEGELARLLRSVAQANANGVALDWDRVFGGARPRIDLPTYAFQRSRHWSDVRAETADVSAAGLDAAEHPMLGALVRLADGDGIVLSGRISVRTHEWLAGHRVGNDVIFPGTGLVELAIFAGDQVGAGRLEELVLHTPLVVPDGAGVFVQVRVEAPDESGQRAIGVYSRPAGTGLDPVWTRHAAGTVTAPGAATAALPPGQWPPSDVDTVDVGAHYERMTGSGYGYGPQFRALSALWHRGREVFAEVSLGADLPVDGFGIHPALFDSALHAMYVLGSGQDGVRLPFTWTGVQLHAAGAGRLRVRMTARDDDSASVELFDETGLPVLTAESLVVRPLRDTARPDRADSLYQVRWQPMPIAEPVSVAVLGDCPSPDGAVVVADLAGVTAALPAGGHVLHRIAPAGPGEIPWQPAESALEFVQTWLADEAFADTRLVLVTRGGVGVTDEDVPDPGAAGVWGLVRSAQSEHPGRLVLADLDDTAESLAALPGALGTGEDQLALRGGALLVPRLVNWDPGQKLLPPAGEAAWRLTNTRPGTFEGLELLPYPEALAPLGPRAVRLRIHAAGINFKDVVVALNLVPGLTGLGGEVAGEVLEIGDEVTSVAVGDRVLGLSTETFGPIGTTDERYLVGVPEGWGWVEAASVPVAYLTAYLGLTELAKIGPGSTVLIHAAAGGVGTAAVQIARHSGATVYATASPGKHAAVIAAGVPAERVFNSRTADFEDEVRAATQGRGVDLVLNCLTGELTDAGLRLVAPGGFFLELGKTDRRDPGTVHTGYPGIRYQAYDLRDLTPDDTHTLLKRLTALFGEGQLTPPRVTAYDVRQARTAFRHLAQATLTGKAVLTMPAADPLSGTVLITGGTGTLGSLLARHLATHHRTPHLHLVSRRGRAAPGATALEHDLEQLGTTVTITAADVTDPETLTGLIAGTDDLTAIVHTAAALLDTPFHTQTPATLTTTAHPKVTPALTIHHHGHRPPPTLITFSSLAATMGGPGQANYAAANAMLDALAQHRRAQGLPSLSLAWGFWEQRSEMSAHLDEVDMSRLSRGGVLPLSTEEGLALFDLALRTGEPFLVPAKLDVGRLASSTEPVPAMLRALVRRPERRRIRATASAGEESLRDRLAAMTEGERRRSVLALVRDNAATVLGYGDADAIGADRAFKELGFDSLTAVEFRNRLTTATALKLPVTLVFDHPTPDELTEFLHTELLGDTPAAPAVPVRATPVVSEVDDPVVIVGMACRYPGGVASPDELWQLVLDERDAVGGFPADRGWTGPERAGGFLTEAASFDAGFFSITPREALTMDPQQRVLLEISWEAIERAGVAPSSLRGSKTGVFVGASAQGYATLFAPGSENMTGYGVTGTSTSVVSGRVSYALGLEGPAVTVDTACSSSLVALHMAARSLRSGECDLALAGGVAIMAGPFLFDDFAKQGGLAEDGRCKAFDASADGTGWSEGAGVLVLERLSAARRAGHRVLAVLRGSAINQDGASNGLTAPSGPAQQRVMRAALADAGLDPSDVDAVEAHGTGTVLGDPIEAQAVLAVYGQDRAGTGPLRLGSLKSNIGHSQAAAGVGGVIKMVHALTEGVLPKTLHLTEPTPFVDWTDGAVELLTTAQPWAGDRRRAAVSSFGISGTNAHVILEQAPDLAAPAGPEAVTTLPALPWVLSGHDETALRAQAHRLHEYLERNPELSSVDVAWSLATSRGPLACRLGLLAADRTAALAALAGYAAGEAPREIFAGTSATGGPAFVFSGQGAQRPGMGAQLYDTFPVFAAAFDEVCAQVDEPMGASLRELVFRADAAELDRTAVAQPALFAVEVALYRLVESWGVTPDYVLGHSVGEITAAHVAGVLSLADAAAMVVARGRLMQALPAGGGMLAVAAPEAQVRALLGDGPVVIAAVNGPAAVVLAGPLPALAEIRVRVEAAGYRARELAVSHAFHSPLMAPMLGEFEAVLGELTYRPPRIPVVSAVTGAVADADELCSPGYWVRQVERTVRFADGVSALGRAGVRAVLELGPSGALAAAAGEVLDRDLPAAALTCVGAARRDRPEVESLLGAVLGLHVHGCAVDWASVLGGTGGRTIPLPTYAFQRRRYWPDHERGARADLGSAGLRGTGHPLLAAEVAAAGGESIFTGELSAAALPWLADHVVGGRILFPATGFAELALVAGQAVGCETLDELTLAAPLVLPPREGVQVQVVVGVPDEDGARAVTVYARPEEGEWTAHGRGFLRHESAPAPAAAPGAWPPAGAVPVDVTTFHENLAEAGFAYGPAFRGLRTAWRRGGEIFAEVAAPPAVAGGEAAFALHPALLDAALQILAFRPSAPAGGRPQLPFSWRGVTVHRRGAGELRVRLTEAGPDTVSVQLDDAAGQPVARVDALALREAVLDRLGGGTPGGALFTVDWSPAPEPEEAGDPAGAVPGILEAPVPPDASGESAPGETAPGETVAERVHDAVHETLRLVRARRADGPILVRTSAAVRVGAGDSAPDPAAAAAWGVLRSARLEHPDRFVLVDSEGALDDVMAGRALAVARTTGETEFALRDGQLLVPRLVKTVADAPAAVAPFGPDPAAGTVLVTGATGLLGGWVARHLVAEHGVRHLLLAARSAAGAADSALARDLAALGATARFAACDVTDREQLARLVEAIPAERPLTSVVHVAGVVRDGVLETLGTEQVDEVLRAKVDAVAHLHELTRELPLSSFVVFSSLAGTLGSAGQANYAAANAAVDALCEQRHEAGLPACSLAWGPWEGSGGMVAALAESDRRRIERGGLRPLTEEQGLALFDRGLGAGQAVVVPVRVDTRALEELPAGAVPALLRGLVRPGRAVTAPAVGPALRDRLAGLSELDRITTLVDLVRSEAAATAALAVPEVSAGKTFATVGFDSLMALELRNRLTQVTGLRLPATMIFDHPTPAALAEFLRAELKLDPVPVLTPALTALAALEEVALGPDADGGEHVAVAARLRLLLAQLEDRSAGAAPDRVPDADLASVSAEELLDMIGDEFGIR
ncbi:type I polyketide synthase [Amycolatopsis sp. DSM 110486]|uniref:type I polyketide synthase n=1 Tax=Amycolatopsis sp. DSM 110486 TaxID=2865832 RepID=UPI001C6A22A1|nr:type I polyketide synthase [Amycolatopsis sp. DSM 110486]QYN17783.1 SDR family NAD(P)-dependent oxidoreductase [Amycolatopsis sp. DSM 110486]